MSSKLENWDHSPLGPSASERWLECPGSVLATKNKPDKSSIYAAEGTVAHMVTEWARDEDVFADKWLGEMIEFDGNFYEVTREMVDAVNGFIEYLNDFDGEMMVEERLHYDAWVPKGFGTADDIRAGEELCVISDFKYGKGVQVYAHENPQLKLYALGFWHDFGFMYPDLKKFQLNVYQPRIGHIDEFTITIEDLLAWANTVVKPGAELALSEGAPFKAGSWCQFCKIRTECKTRAKAVFDLAVGEFDDLDADTPVETADANHLSLEELGLMLPFLPAIKSFCTELEVRALSEIGKGNVVPHPKTGDYKIVEGRSNRKWMNIAPEGQEKDNDELIAAELRRRKKLKVGDIFTKKLKGPAAIEKIIGKKDPVMTDLVHKPPGKPKLAPGTDKRPAMTVDPETEFDDLDG